MKTSDYERLPWRNKGFREITWQVIVASRWELRRSTGSDRCKRNCVYGYYRAKLVPIIARAIRSRGESLLWKRKKRRNVYNMMRRLHGRITINYTRAIRRAAQGRWTGSVNARYNGRLETDARIIAGEKALRCAKLPSLVRTRANDARVGTRV